MRQSALSLGILLGAILTMTSNEAVAQEKQAAAAPEAAVYAKLVIISHPTLKCTPCESALKHFETIKKQHPYFEIVYRKAPEKFEYGTPSMYIVGPDFNNDEIPPGEPQFSGWQIYDDKGFVNKEGKEMAEKMHKKLDEEIKKNFKQGKKAPPPPAKKASWQHTA